MTAGLPVSDRLIVLSPPKETPSSDNQPDLSANGEQPRFSSHRAGDLLPTVAVLTLLLAAWEAVVRTFAVPIYLLPPPSAILERLLTRGDYFAGHTLTTLLEAIGGLAVGGLIAIGLAVIMVHSPAAERVLYPIALVVKVTPIVAIAPLLVIWFGFGPFPKIVIAALVTFFPVLVNTIAGLRDVNPGIVDVLRSVAASRLEVLLTLRVPSALPYLFAAARVAIPLSLIGAVVAEWWGASDGLGRVIFLANSNLDMPTLFAAIVVLGLTGIALTALVAVAERRLLSWHDSARRPG